VYQCEIIWGYDKPDGTPRKLIDVLKMKKIGWRYSTELQQEIEKTLIWLL